MKVGDKLVCIKDFAYQTGGEKFIYILKNEVFEIEDVFDSCLYLKSNDFVSRIRISLIIKEEPIWVSKFEGYFVTLAEFREKRINSILE